MRLSKRGQQLSSSLTMRRARKLTVEKWSTGVSSIQVPVHVCMKTPCWVGCLGREQGSRSPTRTHLLLLCDRLLCDRRKHEAYCSLSLSLCQGASDTFFLRISLSLWALFREVFASPFFSFSPSFSYFLSGEIYVLGVSDSLNLLILSRNFDQ